MDRIGPTPEIRPHPTLGRRLDAAARSCFPVAFTSLFMVLATLPLGLRDQGELLPALALGCVWFWSLHRPASMPPISVFGIGLLLDLLGYLPLGVGALTLLLAHAVALWLRGSLGSRGFLGVWLAFSAVGAVVAALGWAATSLLTFQLLPPDAALSQLVLSAALYPLLAALFARALRTVADPERA